MEEKEYSVDRIPRKEKICYGLGGLMDGGAVAMMSCVMLKAPASPSLAMALLLTPCWLAKLLNDLSWFR